MEISNMSFFEITPFDPQGGQKNRANGISLTICENAINIPLQTFEVIGAPKYVEVGFNRRAHIFAVKPVAVATKISVTVTGSEHSKAIGRVDICKEIEKLRNYGRKTNNLLLNDGWFDEVSGYYMFDLDKGQIVVRSFRGKRS